MKKNITLHKDVLNMLIEGIEDKIWEIQDIKVNKTELEVTVRIGAVSFGEVNLYQLDPSGWYECLKDEQYNREALSAAQKALGDNPNKGQTLYIGDCGFLGRDRYLMYSTTIELEAPKMFRKTSRLPKSAGDSPLIKRLQTLYNEGCWNANGGKKTKNYHRCGEGHFCGTMA